MHFTTILATSAAVGGALAGVYQEEPVYYTSAEQVYTSIKTCTDEPAVPTSDSVYVPPVSEPVYGEPTTEAPVYAPEPTGYGPSEVTYTSYDVITITSCADYVTDCPAATYTSTAYSVSTPPTDYYQPPANSTDYEVPPPVYEYETPEYPTDVPVYEVPSTSEVYTHTYYTTVCPGKDYCYATTVTSTYCPGNPTEVPTEVPVYTPPVDVPSYTQPPVEVPTYTPPVDVPTYNPPTPPQNETETPTYTPPPSYTGAASANFVSFGVAAVAGLAALFIAA
ncbi:uncharacterized protein DFL_007399 [Arthrobotrys flagrans]|uniref:Uncharacterized protein n=1 Tax=Arthrobotrys flagrans TaxID=97331 RepID=A0A436ZVK1_ARTFL|nr:hypothetical protein DFL_007399 [Arthrobotrys flagrans]